MYKIRARIRGLSPLLMHQASVETVGKKTVRGKPTDEDIADEWRKTVYFNEEAGLHIPERVIMASLIKAGVQLNRGKTHIDRLLAGGMIPDRDAYPIMVKGKPVRDLDTIAKNKWVLAVPANVQRNRVIRVRAAIPTGWTAEFTFDIQDEQLSIDQVKKAFEVAGAYIGIMDWRPEKRGHYGRFELVDLERVKK